MDSTGSIRERKEEKSFRTDRKKNYNLENKIGKLGCRNK